MSNGRRIQNAEHLLSHGNVRGRQDVLAIIEAGLQAADPYNNVYALFRIEGNQLIAGHPDFYVSGDPNQSPEMINLDEIERIFVFGAGKGIQYSAKAIEDVLGDRLTGGMVIDKHDHPLILERIGVTYGAHPVPDEGCVLGCQRILEMCADLTERDLVITLAANGVSSLLTLPVEGVSLEDVRRTTHIMQIEKGVFTGFLNPIRNHLDQMKGGRLARHVQPARALHIGVWGGQNYESLLHHNVFLHNMPGGSTFADAVGYLKEYDAWDLVPQAVRDHLSQADPTQESVKPDEYLSYRHRMFLTMPFCLGMLPTAKRKAEELGYDACRLYGISSLEASANGHVLGAMAKHTEEIGEPFDAPCVLLGGGEMIVTVGKESGMGGRNQEFALSAAIRIAGTRRIIIGSVDSDGTDGPGHQFGSGEESVPVLAGGIVDGETMDRASALGIDIKQTLKRHDTSPALWALGDGIIASKNISMNDLTVVLIQGKSE